MHRANRGIFPFLPHSVRQVVLMSRPICNSFNLRIHCFNYWHVTKERLFFLIRSGSWSSLTSLQMDIVVSPGSSTVKWGEGTFYSSLRRELIFRFFSFPQCLTPFFATPLRPTAHYNIALWKKYNRSTIVNTASLKIRLYHVKKD